MLTHVPVISLISSHVALDHIQIPNCCFYISLIDTINCKCTEGLRIIEKLNLTYCLRVMITGVDRVEVSSLLSVLPGTEVYSCCTLSEQADCTPVQ